LRPDYRYVVLAVAVFAFMQAHLHRMAFAPLIPRFVADLGLTYAAAGAIQTAYFLSYTLAQVPIGLIADRWGARRVMVASMAILAAGTLAFAASQGYGQALAARLVVGLGAAGIWVPNMFLVTAWFPPEERGRATGLMSAGGAAGGTLSLILVPWLAGYWGWRTAYGVLTVPALIALALVLVLLPRASAATPPARRRGGTLRGVLTSRAVWVLNLSALFAYGGSFSFITFLPAYLVKTMALSETQAGVITSLLTGGTVVSWPLAGMASDRLGLRKPIYLFSQTASVLVCVAFATIVGALGPYGAAAFALVAGFLIGGTILPFVMIVELFPAAQAATAAGVTNAATFLGGMLVPILLGRVLDVTDSFAAAFLVAATVQAVALVFGLFLTETGRRSYTAGR
jgi:MFS transporter, ACS family, glucarate transporter